MGSHRISHLRLLLTTLILSSQQVLPQRLRNPRADTSNLSTTLSLDQISHTGLDATTANNVAIALDFEQTYWSNGSTSSEPFYDVPQNATTAPPGSLLKLQVDANTSAYTLPPNTALSRVLFQTTTLNGIEIPASAYILWPYLPLELPCSKKHPIVAFAHGTSGTFGSCAPSHIKDLWYQYAAPFALVQAGYVVVAPDYAGLGVDRDARGNAILHPCAANPSHADDVFYAVQAAQEAFAILSEEFVVLGHSEGGGAAWGAAQRQALTPVKGYLGAVAASPLTRFSRVVDLLGPASARLAVLMAHGLPSVFPGFEPGEFLTDLGVKRLALLEEIQGCNSVATELFGDAVGEMAREGWQHSEYATAFENLTAVGGRRVQGPLLVIQGDADPNIPFQATVEAVERTCDLFPELDLAFAVFEGVAHTPVMYASQRVWLDWIADRFAGRNGAARGCRKVRYTSARPYEYYQAEQNWFMEISEDAFEIA